MFDAFNASVIQIEKFAKILYSESLKKKNYEGICFALFYASKYNFMLPIDINDIIASGNCVCKVSMLRYCRIKGDTINETLLRNDALNLKAHEFDENWLFVYEALSACDLQGEWIGIKNAGVSFLI